MAAVVANKPWTSMPTVSPLFSTLLDHADIVEGIDYLQDRGLVDSFNCLDMATPTTLCPDLPGTKDFQPPVWLDGITFAVYGGLTCKPFGFSEATGLAEVERVFRLRESIGVERALMETRFIAGPDDDPGAGVDLRWEAPTDLTPAGGAVEPEVGLAILEGHAGANYAGVPTLHIPRTIGSLLFSDDALVSEGGKAYSKIGSKAALGSGYEYPNNGPAGTAPAAGELWMFATGEVLVARGALTSETAMDTTNNDIYALAERPYVAAIDCYASAVRVTVA